MRFLRRGSTKLRPGDGAQLVAEAGAFLCGSYARVARERRDAVPGWAWLNALAHGDLEAVRTLSRGGTTRRDRAVREQWRGAQRLLADELLGIVGGDAELLGKIQRTVLVPLELRLIATEPGGPLTTFELVRSTRAALRSSIA